MNTALMEQALALSEQVVNNVSSSNYINKNNNAGQNLNYFDWQNKQIQGAPTGVTQQAAVHPYLYTALTGNNYNIKPVVEPVKWNPLSGGQANVTVGNNAFPYESLYGSSGAPKSSSPSSYESSSPSSGSYYGGGGSYGGGSQLAPPPPMPAFHASAPAFDRHSGYDWRPDDPGNVTPIDMGNRPAPYARDVAKYKKLLGEEV
jgi:hypothetical protein